jgi:hypothetical protein
VQDGGTVFSVAVDSDDGALSVAPHVGSGETDRLKGGDAFVDEELRGFCPERFEFVEVVHATPPGERILDNDGTGRHYRRRADVRAGLPVSFVNSCVDRADIHPATS